MIEATDILQALLWLAFIFLLHLPLLPLFRRYLPLVAVPISLSVGVLLYTLISFWFVFFHLPLPLTLLPFLVLLGIVWHQDYLSSDCEGNREIISGFTREWRYYSLFFLVFCLMLLVRIYSPDISSAEKFMDHGFLASIMRSPVIPPLDPWFAGGDLSVYYYIGHWMLATLGLITNTPSPVLFTLALPTIAALSAVNLYGAGNLLMKKFRLLPVLFLFLINPAFLVQVLQGTQWTTLLWNSTRVIDATINEYPLFSFIFGDVHAHVIGFFPQTALILLVATALSCWKKMCPECRLLIILSTGLVLGSIPPINSWDILIQAPLIIVTGLILIIGSTCTDSSQNKKIGISTCLSDLIIRFRSEEHERGFIRFCSQTRGALLYLIAVPALGVACYLPFYWILKTQGIQGIGLVTTPSPVLSFLQVNGWFIIVIGLSVLPVFRKKPWLLLFSLPFILTGYHAAAIGVALLSALIARHEGAGDLLAGAGLLILIFCEVMYLKDSMGEQYYRMNTVFKLYVTAWLLFSVSAAEMGGRMLLTLTNRLSWTVKPVHYLIPLILLLLLFLPGYVTMTHAGPHTPTLDGLAWLGVYHPDDGSAIRWLRAFPGNHVIVEAEDGDYKYFSRVSAFSGIPTIIGWPFHEVMWRGDTPPGWYGERTSALRSIYEDPDQTIPMMKRYGADLLYVGPSEKERYTVNLPPSGLKQVFNDGAVTIYTIA